MKTILSRSVIIDLVSWLIHVAMRRINWLRLIVFTDF
jgi:hypothetical protein